MLFSIQQTKSLSVFSYQTVTTSCEYVLEGTDLALAKPVSINKDSLIINH